jgi:cell division protein FtsW (lipid II flippase)
MKKSGTARFLPVAHTTSSSALAEEQGFAGVLFVLSVYLRDLALEAARLAKDHGAYL